MYDSEALLIFSQADSYRGAVGGPDLSSEEALPHQDHRPHRATQS